MDERSSPGGLRADPGQGDARLTRRRWLRAAALGVAAWLPGSVHAQQKKKIPLTPDDQKIVAAVRVQAKKVGLDEFGTTWTEHFLGVGNGPARYRSEALDHCESIGKDFLAHFRRLGFKLDYPPRRLTVLPLDGAASYRAFIEDQTDEADGGRYILEPNWLLIFDFRADPANAGARRVNTFTLVHETIHLLCYNTGLLARKADVPDCISEGLATYGELWTPRRSPPAFGAVNRLRLDALFKELDNGTPWIPISQFITDDDVFRKPETAQIAYAESWVLVHYLLDTDERLPKFRAYLSGLPALGDSQAMNREKYAESRLGSLKELDAAVRRHAQRMARKSGLRAPAGLTRGPG